MSLIIGELQERFSHFQKGDSSAMTILTYVSYSTTLKDFPKLSTYRTILKQSILKKTLSSIHTLGSQSSSDLQIQETLASALDSIANLWMSAGFSGEHTIILSLERRL